MHRRRFDRSAWGPATLVVLGAIALLAPMVARAATISPPTEDRQGTAPLDAPRIALVADALRAAADQGFAAGAFPSDPAAAAVAYASAQHGGRLPLSAFPPDWAVRPAPYDASAEFAKALAGDRLAGWLASLPPADNRYVHLARGYVKYRAIAATGGWPVLPKTPDLDAGAAGPAVEALCERLAIEDPSVGACPAGTGSPPGREIPGRVFDAALIAAVTRAQARYGLQIDGKVGAATLAALNIPVEERLTQIRANLERWRWVPRALPPYRIEVNTADATLELFDGKAPPMSMRAIVGRAGKATPILDDKVTAVVFNPPWNVPDDIAASEIWPKIRRDPSYQTREGYVRREDGGLRQLPGPRCALGAIKFELSNPFGIYLHDTPARGAFALNRRALSHGCVRLADPRDLARRLLAKDPAWPEAKINLTLLAGKTIWAPLRTAVPAYVFYWTAFANDEDQVQFRPDVYGWDSTLKALLARSGHAL